MSMAPRTVSSILLVVASSPCLARDLPLIEFESAAGPTLPVIASDLHALSGERRLIVLLPELDAAISTDVTVPGQPDDEPFAVGGIARFATLGDVNADGRQDLITTAPTTGRAHVVLQSSDGSFHLGAVLPVGTSPFAPALADLDGDHKPELFIPLRGEAKIAVLPNLGGGLFAAGDRIACAPLPDSLAIADFDKDGVPDIAVTCTGISTIQIYFGSRIDNTVRFDTPPQSLPTGSSPLGLVLSDLDGDGWLDVATACTGSSSISTYYGGPGRDFQAGAFLFAGTSPQSIVASDLDQNGLADLVVANPSTQMLTVLQNAGSRTYTRSTVSLPFRPSRLAASDFDGDGRDDLFASSQTSVFTRLLINSTEVIECPGDVTGDLRVSLTDLNAVLANFGSEDIHADANGDGQINLADLNLVLANFGAICGDE
ncbi:MAG: FG-GAP-like repeat-containing protein [Phycisphaerales bacterium JB050]